MSFRLPPLGSPLRDLFDVRADLVPLGTGERLPATFVEARLGAAATFRGAPRGAIRDVFCIAVRMNGDLELIRFGPRGGHSTLWNFTRGR